MVRDAKYTTLNEATQPFAYLSFAQEWQSDPTLIVRSSADAAALARAITQIVLVAVTLLANYRPARRASMADPMRVLRGE